MNADELEIYDFLKGYVNTFVSVTEISKKLGKGRRFEVDRTWARQLLRRMEMDGVLESNPFGEYKLCVASASEVDFEEALRTPGVTLGDSTIIRLEDFEKADAAS